MSDLTVFKRPSTFVVTAAAAAIGLGNLWRFPALLAEYGGAPFLLAYIAAVLVLALPILMAEAVLARRFAGDLSGGFRDLLLEHGLTRFWLLIPLLGLLAVLLIFTYYSVVAGWCIAYLKPMYYGFFIETPSREAGSFFNQLLGQPRLMAWHSGAFIAILVALLALNVRLGVAKVMRLLIPIFIIGLILLCVYALKFGDAEQAYAFLFHADPYAFTPELIVAATGQAFYSLSIGCAMMLSIGQYAPQNRSLLGMLGWVVILDTLVSLLAALIIFPIILSLDIRPESGPSLLFVAMPYAFGQMVYGDFFGLLFFLMLACLALSSGIALLAPVVEWLSKRFSLWRSLAALLLGGMITGLTVLSILSLTRWSELGWLGVKAFQWPDLLVGHFILPITALLTAILVAWRIRTIALRDVIHREFAVFFWPWLWGLRFITVPLMLVFMLYLMKTAFL